MLDFHNSGDTFKLSAAPVGSISYALPNPLRSATLRYPEAFTVFPPFVAVADYTGLYKPEENAGGNTLVIEFDTKDDKVTPYPQDWYNKAAFNHSKVRIAQIAKDKSGFMHGRGLHMDNFILGLTGRELIKL